MRGQRALLIPVALAKWARLICLAVRAVTVEAMHPEFLNHQACKACGRRDKTDFHVPDEVWERVVPERLRDRVVCLACFDGFAKERGVEYAPYLSLLYFAGEQASLAFVPTTCSCRPSSCPGTRCTTRQSSASCTARRSRSSASSSSSCRSAMYRFLSSFCTSRPFPHLLLHPDRGLAVRQSVAAGPSSIQSAECMVMSWDGHSLFVPSGRSLIE